MDPKRVQDAAKNQSAEKIEFGALQPDEYRHHQLPTKDGLSWMSLESMMLPARR